MTCGGSTPTYYVPSDLVPKLEKARECFSDIDATCTQSNEDDMPKVNRRDKSLLNMNIVPVRAGEEIEIKQTKVRNGVRYYLRPFDVCHGGHPALGYSLVSKTTKKDLKKEYIGMDRSKLSTLVKEGVVLQEKEVSERVEVCYTGDTNVDGLRGKGISKNEQSQLYLKEAFTAPLIISELTYLEKKDQELAKTRGHLNIFDIQPIFQSHGWGLTKNNEFGEPICANDGSFDENRKIVFYHLSGRHGTAERIIHGIEKALPRDLLKVSEVALSSFISDPEETTVRLGKNGCVIMKDYLDDGRGRLNRGDGRGGRGRSSNTNDETMQSNPVDLTCLPPNIDLNNLSFDDCTWCAFTQQQRNAIKALRHLRNRHRSVRSADSRSTGIRIKRRSAEL